MTGSFRVLQRAGPPGLHDHVDIVTTDGVTVRFNDPRRFGSVLWTAGDPADHPLLAPLGPEPLGPDFTAAYLRARSRRRSVAIKPHIMNAHIVVGVGNIYASEALFRAGIHPARSAGRVSLPRLEALVTAIRDVLTESIRDGGTTLRDFHNGDGQPGYFTQRLRVYDRAGSPCMNCGAPLRQVVLGQRSSYYCARCQR
jgi:formamidopyrimidine-DNA glycosylase